MEFFYTRIRFDNFFDDGEDKEDETLSNENQKLSSRDNRMKEEESNSSTNNEEENQTNSSKEEEEKEEEDEEEEKDRKEKKEDNLGFALDLFSVADRFLVTELRDLCTDVILRGIRVENVSKIYSMADRRMLHDL